MKIIINYDLIDKIKEAETGFSLIRTTKTVLIKSTTALVGFFLVSLCFKNSFQTLAKNSFYAFSIYLAAYWLLEATNIKKNKIKALEEIKRLAIQLKELNICTEQELLMNSSTYKKEHKLVNKENSIIPKIKQKKYIMVPIYDNGEIKEISLLQEHIIGSKYYVISYGEPNKQKVFRPAFGSI